MNQEYNYLFKLLLIGNSAVGKSCLLLRFSDNIFNENYISTIGVDFKIKTMTVGDAAIKLQIWDTAGQERFKTITSSYYKGSHGIMIVYDVTDEESFKSVETWLAEVDKLASGNVVKLLIGNKADLAGQRKITYEQGLDMAKRWGMEFMETSAKSCTNVQECFKKLTEDIYTRVVKSGTPKGTADVMQKAKRVTVSSGKPVGREGGSGCCG